ncbi:hypothetical protein PCANC_06650 [Puccinia coronata f. sp. avenae]|uniref:Cwf19-like C-terminal domain-containing protein n=1 Tax=Puccinia coronata f. sp. avenae TaxID=200324 RepID=A0A2N5T032_9BASI|nr:hypothetical protein PCANC_06650 [Puccinia coronata f. sp. avenae]PLW33683.1 hypothetical protein PCASD_10319 [Puccinia coronata f. sp. avenae]
MAKGKDQATSGKEKEKGSKHRSSKKKHKQQKRKVDQEQDESDEWVEKEEPVETSVPVPVSEQPDPTTTTSDGQDKEGESSTRESCMASQDKAAAPEGIQDEDDYLNRMGTLVSSRANKEKDIQAKAVQKEFQPQSSSSIKRLGADDPEYQPNAQPTQTPIIPGGPGYQWRLNKLRRTYDTAQEENRSIEEVALERYGTMEAWEQANEERRIVEDRRSGGGHSSGRSTPRQDSSSYDRRYMFTNQEGPSSTSRPNSRASFRKPTSALNTPEGGRLGINKRVEEIRARPSVSNPVSPSSSSSGPSTPIPSVINPLANRASLHSANKAPANTTTLNKLQASIMKAKIMDPDAVPELERQYKEALDSHRSNSSATEQTVELVPSLDARGRMYDIGAGAEEDDASSSKPGNKRKKEAKFEARDLKTGELLRFNPDDDQITLGQMVRQEKLQAGAADQKNFDVEMASRIMGDAKFENDLDYMDDNADRLARKKMKTDASKRLFAINDYARTRKALETCEFCFKDDGGPPANLGIISSGTKVYLSCTQFEELVDGHCWIVPMQHCLSSLELDDDVWDEIKNYMKCLMKMFAEKHDKGVVFYETVLSFKYQRHTYIEAVPIPWDLFNDIPAYFRESINSSESEWSQHKKLIDFSERPGGFRRSMVSQLPYFMIQWDYRGEKGFGHVIEGDDDHPGSSKADPGVDGDHTSIVDDGLKGTKFPRYFAAEIIGNLLELEPHKWRRPKRIGPHAHHKPKSHGGSGSGSNSLTALNRARVDKFLKQLGYSEFDWIGLL